MNRTQEQKDEAARMAQEKNARLQERIGEFFKIRDNYVLMLSSEFGMKESRAAQLMMLHSDYRPKRKANSYNAYLHCLSVQQNEREFMIMR